MMKKLAMVCALVLVAGSAFAAPYTWNLNGSDSAGSNFGVQLRLGVQTSASTPGEADFAANTAGCYVTVLNYGGPLGPGIIKNNLYSTYKLQNTDPQKYILQVNGAADWVVGTAMDVRIWASSSSAKPAGAWKLYKLYDPISDTWGRTELTTGLTNGITATSTGSLASPWFKTSLPSFKTTSPYGEKNGYILELSVPEPGSMVAMLSGLVGLVGFGIRRRK